MTTPGFAPIHFAPAQVDIEHLADGGLILKSPVKLEAYADKVCEKLEYWAKASPDRVFLRERSSPEHWRQVTYRETLGHVRAIAQALLDRSMNTDTPLVILSENSIDNALLQLAALYVGIPVAPISPAYSLMSQDHAKLKYIIDLLQPVLLYVSDGQRYSKALAALDLCRVEVVTSGSQPEGISATLIAELMATTPTAAVDMAYAGVGPDSIAKILFTSGSTGLPKGVINTQRMLCSNQQAIAQVWPFLAEAAPEILDWLPWNHTFGANHNFNMMLFHGGTLNIDSGKPAPGLIEQSVANLREISPTLYFNVPQGFAVLLPYLEADETLRERFFARLQLIFYAGADLPQNLWTRIESLSVKSRGLRVPMVSAWGSTETAPLITSVHFPIERAGVIGLPAPGCVVKMVPNNDKMELRVKGPNITPGYWHNPQLTREVFDEQGFYLMGDAGRLLDEEDPVKGICFDGRVAEDFKLNTGVWVHVGALRMAAISAAAPLIQDAVVTGQGRDEVGLLIFPSLAGCRSLCVEGDDLDLMALINTTVVIENLRQKLAVYNRNHAASSLRFARVVMMAEPPSIDANEITDKGYINQHAVLERRADLVEQLYAGSLPQILVL